MRTKVKVEVDIERLAERYREHYMNPRRLAEDLGVSTRTAGKVLARMERAGLAVRVSKYTYKVLSPRTRE